MQMQQCKGVCAKVLPVDAFHRNAKRPNGRCLYCKECRKKTADGDRARVKRVREAALLARLTCSDRSAAAELEFPKRRMHTITIESIEASYA